MDFSFVKFSEYDANNIFNAKNYTDLKSNENGWDCGFDLNTRGISRMCFSLTHRSDRFA